ncbi:MAG: filamentous hemagglutinin N-terminal domain-containing protein [Nostocaceae cyanobacterium]|nr:filamentous hemagglutinin N-terminal domain-containing protein [Nostocaceae cyanobacterium]
MTGSEIANAQITTDTTLPNNSSVTVFGDTISIDGGTQKGNNLFHSFTSFSLPRANKAHFNNALQIQNIFSRVTGGEISNIDGLIKANGEANLFILNPNGIIFGPNARLDINGSFVASTANSIKFADGSQFSAKVSESTPLLTISVPVGLQFGGNPGSIQLQGNSRNIESTDANTCVICTSYISLQDTNGLQVSSNQTLALVGGDISLQGATLKTPGGRIELGSVVGSGLVSLIPIETGFALDYNLSPQKFGDIKLFAQATVDASGEAGGDIQIMGRSINLSDGSQIQANTLGSQQGGNLIVNATESVQLIGATENGSFTSGLFARAEKGSTGNGGNLTINTGELLVRDGAEVSASNWGDGKGGDLTVNAQKVELVGVFFTPDFTFPSGLFANANGGTGDAGNLTINTQDLLLQDGGQIAASTRTAGSGGNLTVNAQRVQLIGSALNGWLKSGLFARVKITGTGDGGNLTVNTGELLVQDGATITVGTEITGTAGNLSITADSILLDNQATLTADTKSISTDANQEQAMIALNSQDLILRRGSSITTNANGEGVIGGNITINTEVLAALENSDISANSTDSRGGRMTINAEGIFGTQVRKIPTPESDITTVGATPELIGNIQINTPDVDTSHGLVALSENIVDVTDRISQGCSASGKMANAESRFTITGRGGIPKSPTDLFTGQTALVNLFDFVPGNVQQEYSDKMPQVVSSSETPLSNQFVEAQGLVVDANGKVTLVAQVPQVKPYSPGLIPPVCSDSFWGTKFQ